LPTTPSRSRGRPFSRRNPGHGVERHPLLYRQMPVNVTVPRILALCNLVFEAAPPLSHTARPSAVYLTPLVRITLTNSAAWTTLQVDNLFFYHLMGNTLETISDKGGETDDQGHAPARTWRQRHRPTLYGAFWNTLVWPVDPDPVRVSSGSSRVSSSGDEPLSWH
jgi:hypothetical protein